MVQRGLQGAAAANESVDEEEKGFRVYLQRCLGGRGGGGLPCMLRRSSKAHSVQLEWEGGSAHDSATGREMHAGRGDVTLI